MAVAQQYHQNLVHYLRKEVNYNDPGIATGVVIGRLPANAQVTQALARVRTTFNAGTTNVLTAGTNPANYDNILGTADIAEACAKAGHAIERAEVRLPGGPIRMVGEHAISLHLHSDIDIPVPLTVVAEE